jgi:drug/metabolite transporter (DMT)-like permease
MSPERKATLWLLAMTWAWGASFFTMKLGEEGTASVTGPASSAAAFLFLRFAAAVLLFPLVFPRSLGRLDREAWKAGLLLSIPFFAGFMLQVIGLSLTSATVSAFLTSLTVLTTPLLGRLCFGERLTGGLWGAAGLAVAGIWVLTDPAGGGFGKGEVLTALSAVAWALQIQWTGTLTRKADPSAITFVQFAAMTVWSGIATAALGTGPATLAAALRAPHVAWTVLFTATVCSIAAISIMNRYQREIPATRAAILYSLEPVAAALCAAAFIGEALSPAKLAGGAIIVGANLLAQRPALAPLKA